MWIHFGFSATKQRLPALFGTMHSIHHVSTVWHFRSRFIIFRPQPSQYLLDLMAVIRAIIILLMQDQPNFKSNCSPP